MVKPKCFNLLELKSPEAPAVLRTLSLCSLPISPILSNLICISEQSAKGNAWARCNGVGDKNNRFHTEALPSDTVMHPRQREDTFVTARNWRCLHIPIHLVVFYICDILLLHPWTVHSNLFKTLKANLNSTARNPTKAEIITQKKVFIGTW